MLNRKKNKKMDNMKKEKSCGCVVIKDRKILVIYQIDGFWGFPKGHVEKNETELQTAIREIKEETNLDVKYENLELIDIVSGSSRRNDYPNGDVVINNTALYCIKNWTGKLKWDDESKDMKFFDLDNLPENQNDSDLIAKYIEKINKNS